MATFGGHLFYDLFLQGWGGHDPLDFPLDPLLRADVQKRGISDPTKRTDVLQYFLKRSYFLIFWTAINNTYLREVLPIIFFT